MSSGCPAKTVGRLHFRLSVRALENKWSSLVREMERSIMVETRNAVWSEGEKPKLARQTERKGEYFSPDWSSIKQGMVVAKGRIPKPSYA